MVATCSNAPESAISCVGIDLPQYKYMFVLPHITHVLSDLNKLYVVAMTFCYVELPNSQFKEIGLEYVILPLCQEDTVI